jgi:predicted metal-dependent peptidase
MNQDAARKITRARSKLIFDHPFFGVLALRLHLVEDEKVNTLATDGRRIRYNPKFITDITIGETVGVVCHEVMHCVLNHMGRLNGREPRKWNMACDYAINPDLIDAGFELPQGGLNNPAYQGMSAEHIYSLLPDAPDDGSAPDDLDNGQSDQLTPEEEREWKIATVQAANEAKKAGKLSKAMEQFIDDLVTPKVDWKNLLRQFVTQVSNADYSWQRPNRRMLVHGLIMPGLYSESMGEIAVFKDISGSIDHATTAAFSAEIKSIIEDLRPEKTHVLYVNSEVVKSEEYEPEDFKELNNMVGGGTDFRPPFAMLEEKGIEPKCAIYLTDLEGPFPEVEAPYPVLWCTINNLTAPWGETVRIEV